jgi:hypothetical protein
MRKKNCKISNNRESKKIRRIDTMIQKIVFFVYCLCNQCLRQKISFCFYYR